MAETTAPRSRDDVLVAFHAAHPRPTADHVADWTARHPDCADDLREHAEAMLAGIQEAGLRPEPSQALLARTRGAALDALEAARARAAAPAPAVTLPDLLAAADTDVPRLARALGFGRAPLVDLFQGRVVTPVPAALLAALADALRTTLEAVDAATRAAAPRVGLAKAEAAPSAPRRPFADILRDDPSTPPDVKARWLALLEG